MATTEELEKMGLPTTTEEAAQALKQWVAPETTENPYKINYDDGRFAEVESSKNAALKEVEDTYGGMMDKTDSFYQQQTDAVKNWEKTQTQLQNEQTDFAISQIEQQKEQTKKDYLKEQSGAYTDWQKQSNQYGVNEEAEAMQGMSNTGYSESSQVAMYTAYQNRVATAKQTVAQAMQNYENSITQARLTNNSALAEIAFTSLQQQLEFALQGFQYKNQLLLDQADRKLQVENLYYNRWQDVLAQMNQENSLAEQIRQYNEGISLEKMQFLQQLRAFDYENGLGIYANQNGGSSGGGAGTVSHNTWLANLSKKDRAAYEKALQNQLTGGGEPVEEEPLFGPELAPGLSTEAAISEKLTGKKYGYY